MAEVIRKVGSISKDTIQMLNPLTGHYILKNATTGQILGVKTDGKKFRGVPYKKSVNSAHPAIGKRLANKVEKAVISLLKEKSK